MKLNNNDNGEELYRQRRELASKIGMDGKLLKASLIERFTICTRPGCRCARGHKHGPYLYISVFDGKRSRQIYVPKSMAKEVRSWVKNYDKAKKLIDSVSAHNIELIRLSHQKGRSQEK